MPDNTVQEVRTSVLRYLRMYEEGGLSLGDLRKELAVMAPIYEHMMGSVEDHFLALLIAAAHAETTPEEFESAVTRFRRAEAAW